MELRQLRYFVEAVRRRSITKAAAALHVVQPALTAQIRALEDELKVRLLDRSPRGVTPTPEGEVLLADARGILEAVDRIKTRHAAPRTEAAVVRVGIPNGMTAAFTPGLIARVHARLGADVQVEVVEGLSGFILEWLKSRRIDVGVLFAFQPLRSLDTRPLSEQALQLIGPPGELCPDLPVEFASLADYPLILINKKHGLAKLIHDQARRCGVALDVRATVSSVTEIKHLIGMGMGYTLLAPIACADEVSRGVLSSAPLRNPEMRRELVSAMLKPARADSLASQVRELLHDIPTQ